MTPPRRRFSEDELIGVPGNPNDVLDPDYGLDEDDDRGAPDWRDAREGEESV